MKANLSSLGAGLLFGLGLGFSGMTLPSKVIGFLDVTGAWDASLAFVMMGALAVHFVLFRLVKRRASPLFDAKFHLPTRSDIDPKLVLGAALFGVGWGLGGYCPGPGLVSAASGSPPALLFVLTMAVGMLAQHATQARSLRRQQDRQHHESVTTEAPQGSSAAAKGS
jgi:uncharacterized membrane protein YedE/YeeE